MSFELNNAQIRADMGQVDGELRRVLSLPRYSKPIRVALDYLIKSPGKRLRPLLTVLSYLSIAGDVALPKSVIRLATAIELIHMASLVHDDIIDAADTRHGQPSFHKQFGVEVAIPVGVLLYSISLKLLADVGLCNHNRLPANKVSRPGGQAVADDAARVRVLVCAGVVAEHPNGRTHP